MAAADAKTIEQLEQTRRATRTRFQESWIHPGAGTSGKTVASKGEEENPDDDSDEDGDDDGTLVAITEVEKTIIRTRFNTLVMRHCSSGTGMYLNFEEFQEVV